MTFRDGSATQIPTVTIHLGKLRSIDAATEMQLRSISHDSYDQFAEIFSSRYLQYPTLPLQFLTPKKSISPMTLSVRNMDDERGAMLTQSAKVWTHRVRRPPFWLIVTALDRNRSLPVIRMQLPLSRWLLLVIHLQYYLIKKQRYSKTLALNIWVSFTM